MKIKCPPCAMILEVPDSSAGQVVGCPCGKRLRVPGQSVGKKVVGTRIVDRDSGNQVGFLQGVLLRDFVFSLITGVPCLGPIVAIANLVMLFPLPHETLHDKLARTVVVQA